MLLISDKPTKKLARVLLFRPVMSSEMKYSRKRDFVQSGTDKPRLSHGLSSNAAIMCIRESRRQYQEI
jgi:hypothetical protein